MLKKYAISCVEKDGAMKTNDYHVSCHAGTSKREEKYSLHVRTLNVKN